MGVSTCILEPTVFLFLPTCSIVHVGFSKKKPDRVSSVQQFHFQQWILNWLVVLITLLRWSWNKWYYRYSSVCSILWPRFRHWQWWLIAIETLQQKMILIFPWWTFYSHFLCLSQDRNWISSAIFCSLFVFIDLRWEVAILFIDSGGFVGQKCPFSIIHSNISATPCISRIFLTVNDVFLSFWFLSSFSWYMAVDYNETGGPGGSMS